MRNELREVQKAHKFLNIYCNRQLKSGASEVGVLIRYQINSNSWVYSLATPYCCRFQRCESTI